VAQRGWERRRSRLWKPSRDFAGGPPAPPPSVDPAKYEQIKPVLDNAATKYVESIRNIERLVGEMVHELRATRITDEVGCPSSGRARKAV
jgi:hypothetical protein